MVQVSAVVKLAKRFMNDLQLPVCDMDRQVGNTRAGGFFGNISTFKKSKPV
jgi:hypothetical protein